MAKRYCLLCRKESDSSEYESCPHCGAMGKWAQPVEDLKDDFGRKVDPRIQCPDGLLHDFKQVESGQRCIKCGLTKEDIDIFFEKKGITFFGG